MPLSKTDSQLNILHLVNLDTIGGVEELFYHFLEDAPPHNHHLLVTGNLPHPYFREKIKNSTRTYSCEKFIGRFKIPKLLSSFRYQKKMHYIKKTKPDVIVLWNRFEDISNLKENLPSHCSIVYYEHGASWIEKKETKLADFFSHLTCIIANSYAAKKLLEQKWGPKIPITVVENPLRPDIVKQVLPKKLEADQNSTIHIGYIGRLIPLKGVPLLLHAIKLLIDRSVKVSLSIAGSGECLDELKKEADTLKIQDSIQFLGSIKDVSHFYDSIDLLVVPSIREPLGLVALEASLRGCPVIASLVDGLPEVVLNEKTGLCLSPTLSIDRYPEFGGRLEKLPDLVYDPISGSIKKPQMLDPQVIADSIQHLIENPQKYESFSKEAIEFAENRACFAKYRDLLMQNFSMSIHKQVEELRI